MPSSWNAVSLTEELEAIRGRARLAVVLGSGLSALAGLTETSAGISYADIPGFGATSVEGHPGRLMLSRVGGREVLLFAGRFHAYEGLDADACGAPVSLAAALGCSRIILTQAAGSLDRRLEPGSWLIPSDIVTLPARFVLAAGARLAPPQGGAERWSMGVPLISARLRSEIRDAALEAGVPAADGVVFYTTGPSYETAGEARAAALIGAGAATMSSLPELRAARECGLEAALASWITNYAAPLSSGRVDHADVCRMGAAGAASLHALLVRLLCRPAAQRRGAP